MAEWLQKEWQKLGGGALIFLPLALLFGAAVALRRLLYRSRILPSWRAPVPVIVCGNITAGGSGKTPLALAVLEILLAKGWNPGVVARGYGRVPPREADPLGVVRVYPDIATPEHFGDEPVLIARRSRVPVYISPDRPAAARALLEAHPEVDVLVSDDGLQHYALQRDVELAVVDGERRFGNGLLLPSGPLREPTKRLREVDAVILNGGGEEIAGARRFDMRLGRERFAALARNDELSAEEFALMARGRAVAAIAGIGNPDRFFEHLERLGIRARTRAFPDHHAFQPSELRLAGAEVVVMTEKDAVKCAAFADARMWFMRVDAILPQDFEEFLLARIAKARRSADGPQAA
ncbi:MAG TPA: tetraacyldisaccharide 4'-kinase [Usitatibacter sp.]|nr:tetraacyldisaccharide 4'-kinase [Usitatibacter sp.]